jgi:site-specific recombinase XerD
MSEISVIERPSDWIRLKALVIDSVSSPTTRRLYNMALDEFAEWFGQAPRPGFSKATVNAWRASLEVRGLSSSSISIRLSAIRKLATEAADNGLIRPELAASIIRVKGVRSSGVRVGNWLTQQQAQQLLSTPDRNTPKGKRDRAMIAVLLGCGLRRSEVAALTFAHIQQRDGRWCIVDLLGKHRRVRTVPMPSWVKIAIDTWSSAAGLTEGPPLPGTNRRRMLTADAHWRATLTVTPGCDEVPAILTSSGSEPTRTSDRGTRALICRIPFICLGAIPA